MIKEITQEKKQDFRAAVISGSFPRDGGAVFRKRNIAGI